MVYLAGAAASSALDLIASLQQALGGASSSAAQSPSTFDPAATPSTTPTSSTTATSTSTSAPASPLSPSTLNALFSLQGEDDSGADGQQPLLLVNGNALSQQLFSMLDTNGDGQISQSEFDAAFGQNGNTAQANSLFNQISDGGSSISLQQLTNAIDGQDQTGATQGQGQFQGLGGHHHHHGGGGGGGFDIASLLGGAGGSAGADSGSSANSSTQGDTTQTVTNTDGSTTTTITYADGSQVSMTIPAASSSSSSSNNGSSSSNSGAGSVTSLNNFIEQMIQRQAQMLAGSTVGQSVAVSA